MIEPVAPPKHNTFTLVVVALIAVGWVTVALIVLVQLLLSLQYLLPGLVKLHVSGFRWFGPENIAKETTRIAAVWQPDWSQLIITNRSIAAGVGAFAAEMKKRGFTDRQLEMMFKDNPAKAIGLPVATSSAGR